MMKLHVKPLTTWRLLHQQAREQSELWRRPVGFETGISVYNPIVRRKVPLILKNHRVVKWYMCGPTVYDSAHIGHACSYVRFDIIRRILTSMFDLTVVPVMGITDIDDKIIHRSQGSSRFPSWRELSRHYEQEFHSEMSQLNVLPPYLYCRVTDYIPEIVAFISTLVSNNFTYLAPEDNSLYFDAAKFSGYGKLYKIDETSAHAFKKSPLDFALWKAAKPGEPFWQSPWGPGRPGWHIECSAMASLTLGSSIDVHSGGIDLTFPHHENEEAQSCCHHGVDQWVNYWLHSGLLHLEDVKMSKSLQNTVSIRELLETYTANQFRLLCLHTHYRSPIEFSHEKMQKAVALLRKFEYFQSDCTNYVAGQLPPAKVDAVDVYSRLRSAETSVKEALANDFATPRVIDELSDLVAMVHKALHPGQEAECSEVRNADCIAAVSTFVSRTLSSLGICRAAEATGAGDRFNEVVDTFVKFRTTVRNRVLGGTKDAELLEACDDARKSLAGCGVKVKDYKDGATWTLTEE